MRRTPALSPPSFSLSPSLTGGRQAVLQRRDELLVQHLRLVVARGHVLGLCGKALALHRGRVQLRVRVANLLLQHKQLEALWAGEEEGGGRGGRKGVGRGGGRESVLGCPPPLTGQHGVGAVRLSQRAHNDWVLRDEGGVRDAL